VDDNAESPGSTISAFSVSPKGLPPDESGAPCATNGELKRARSAVKVVVAAAAELTDKIETTVGRIPIGNVSGSRELAFVKPRPRIG
jgi:hypothetical protein